MQDEGDALKQLITTENVAQWDDVIAELLDKKNTTEKPKSYWVKDQTRSKNIDPEWWIQQKHWPKKESTIVVHQITNQTKSTSPKISDPDAHTGGPALSSR